MRFKASSVSSRWLAMTGAAAFALGIASFLIARGVSDGGRAAIADMGTNPPEAPAIDLPWPDFAGQVLHWQNYSYSYSPESPDRANGHEIRGDIWVLVASDNTPLALRGRFTFADGSFYQDYLYVNNHGTVVYDEPIQSPDDKSAPTCRVDSDLNDSTFRDLVNPGEPMFVDFSKMESAGFAQSETEPNSIRVLDRAEVDAVPAAILGDGTGAAQVWSRQSPCWQSTQLRNAYGQHKVGPASYNDEVIEKQS